MPNGTTGRNSEWGLSVHAGSCRQLPLSCRSVADQWPLQLPLQLPLCLCSVCGRALRETKKYIALLNEKRISHFQCNPNQCNTQRQLSRQLSGN